MSLLSDELVEKALKVQSAEELLALAQKNDIELSKEDANMYYEMIKQTQNTQ